MRQLLTESVSISVVGGVLGSSLALWLFQGLVALALPTAIHPEVPVPALELDFSADLRAVSRAGVYDGHRNSVRSDAGATDVQA